MSTYEIALKALEVLDYQQAYFRSRDLSLLTDCRQLEARLREECVKIVDEHDNGLQLFG